MLLEKDQQKNKIRNPLAFLSSVSHWHVKGLLSNRISLKVDVLQDRNKYCLQARPCIFQPGNVTGRVSEGVNYV